METPPDQRPGLVPSSSGVPAPRNPELRARRWRLFRDLAVFQGKLLLDGIKDLVLGPVSLIAAGLGLVFNRDDPGRSFYQVMRMGRGFDRWVDLFGEHRRAQAALPPAPGDPTASEARAAEGMVTSREGLDAYVARVERVLSEQVQRGGLTAKAKDAIDQALDSLNDRKNGSGGPTGSS